MAYTTDIRTAQAGIFGRINEFRKAWAERTQRYALYRKTLNELDSLSDRDLQDLGMHRSQIEEFAWAAALKK